MKGSNTARALQEGVVGRRGAESRAKGGLRPVGLDVEWKQGPRAGSEQDLGIGLHVPRGPLQGRPHR